MFSTGKRPEQSHSTMWSSIDTHSIQSPNLDSLLLVAQFFTKKVLPILVCHGHHVGTWQGKNARPNLRRATAQCLCRCIKTQRYMRAKTSCLAHWVIEAYIRGSTNNNPQTLVPEDAGRQLHQHLSPFPSVSSKFDESIVVTRRNSADLKS